MSAMPYLILTKTKNQLKEILRRPASLVFTVVMTALLIFTFVSSPAMTGQSAEKSGELYVLLFLLYSVTFGTGCVRGFHSGATFYTMSDAQLLFPIPVRPIRVLFYGLIRQAVTSLLVGFFLLFQYSWIHQRYGVTPWGMVAILLVYALCMFCAQLTSMALYSFTSSSPEKRAFWKGVFIAFYAAAAAYIVIPVLVSGGSAAAILDRMQLAPIRWFPLIGWLGTAGTGLVWQSYGMAAAAIGLLVAYMAALILLLVSHQPDFYEDVLLATEVSHSAITAKKEGRMTDGAPIRVKVGQTGLRKGSGASVFFYKHLLEDRRSRIFLLDANTLIFMAITIGWAYFQRANGLISVFVFATYLQIFTTLRGRWVKELTLPYVYMLPLPSFIKLFNLCKEAFLKASVEAALTMGAVSLVLGFSLPLALACMFARFGFSVLFIAGTILVERVWSSLTNRIMVTFLYFFILLLLCVPGVLAAALLAIFFPLLGTAFPYFAIGFWNLAISALLLFLCRHLLDYAELNNR